MTARYANLEGGRYLEATFGFTFTEDPALQGVQDALFVQASEVARWRGGLRRMIQSMREDFEFMVTALDKGDLWSPLVGDGPARNPYAAARKIEEAERQLKTWCAAVAALQAAHTQETK
jgi:hypothetical protein